MSFISTLSFVVGGTFLALLVIGPIFFIYWIMKKRSIKKKVEEHFRNKVTEKIKNSHSQEETMRKPRFKDRSIVPDTQRGNVGLPYDSSSSLSQTPEGYTAKKAKERLYGH